MSFRKSHLAALGLAVTLGGCDFTMDALWPSLTGDDAEEVAIDEEAQAQEAAAAQAEAERNAAPASAYPAASAAAPSVPTARAPLPPMLNQGQFVPPTVKQFSPSGTFVGNQIAQMRTELLSLQQKIMQHNQNLQAMRQQATRDAQTYHGTIAAVDVRLQMGTTPGNPILVSQWNAAQQTLDKLSSDVAQMNSLSSEVAGDSSLSTFLLEKARASYSLSGAVDEDHRQLAILEDETNQTVVLIERLLTELSEDINRQTNYIANERRNLQTLALAVKNGETYGASLSNQAYGRAALAATPQPNFPSMSPAQAQTTQASSPLVIVRFDRPDVQFEQALYTAVSQALQIRPNAAFNIVAVAPKTGTTAKVALATTKAKRNAEKVLRSLMDMGLPGDRVQLSAMSSPNATTSEVHVYVR